jgi:transposase
MSDVVVSEVRERVRVLISEICQIHAQYKIEVPKQRRPWPKSILDRIFELWSLGMTTHQIATETGLPAQTMYSWKQRMKKSESPGFRQITKSRRQRRRSRFDLQLSQLENKKMTTTVTVVVSDGTRVEGVPLESAAELVRKIGQA